MSCRNCLAAIAVATMTGILGTATRVSAFHTVFDFPVDRLEADGNVFGPADGAADFVDEFDDGDLLPNWFVLFGTAFESDGLLHLTNPGTHYEVAGVLIDRSDVMGTVSIEDGAGDLTATAVFTVTSLPLNSAFSLALHGSENYTIGIVNLDSAVASEWGEAPLGYSIVQAYSFADGDGYSGDYTSVALDEGQITGNIVLRLVFDDTTNMLTGFVSVDGGTTFQNPLPPHTFFNVMSVASLGFFADPREVQVVPVPTMTSLGRLLLGALILSAAWAALFFRGRPLLTSGERGISLRR